MYCTQLYWAELGCTWLLWVVLGCGGLYWDALHNVHFVKYDVTVSFMAQVLDTVAYFVSHVLVVDTVTYFDIFR